MKIFRNIILWVAILAYLIVVSGFMKEKQDSQLINALNIKILDEKKLHFIDAEDIREILYGSRIPLLGEKTGTIQLKMVEEKLKQKQIIRQAEVYITERGVLHVDIQQREPFVRIFNGRGQSYYFDREGNIIPVSRSFSPFVMVVNGHIFEPFSIGQTRNIWESPHDSLNTRENCIYELFSLSQFIEQDNFWKSQIEQIYVNSSGEFELVPRVGSHIIEFGRADQMEEKFNKLKLLYIEGFNNLGWNQYSRIKLKYENQIVCIKK
jgi:cell division protein FtsQ